MNSLEPEVAGRKFASEDIGVDNEKLSKVNEQIKEHTVEKVGATLRSAMTAMKKIYA